MRNEKYVALVEFTSGGKLYTFNVPPELEDKIYVDSPATVYCRDKYSTVRVVSLMEASIYRRMCDRVVTAQLVPDERRIKHQLLGEMKARMYQLDQFSIFAAVAINDSHMADLLRSYDSLAGPDGCHRKI